MTSSPSCYPQRNHKFSLNCTQRVLWYLGGATPRKEAAGGNSPLGVLETRCHLKVLFAQWIHHFGGALGIDEL